MYNKRRKTALFISLIHNLYDDAYIDVKKYDFIISELLNNLGLYIYDCSNYIYIYDEENNIDVTDTEKLIEIINNDSQYITLKYEEW